MHPGMRMQIQLSKLVASFQSIPEDMKRRFTVNGEPLIEEGAEGRSPMLGASFSRTTGFNVPVRPTLASSGASQSISATEPTELVLCYHLAL